MRTINLKVLFIAGILLAFTMSAGFACEEHDRAAIHNLMMQQWHKPDAPLTTGPIAIEGPFAMLGWLQGNKGGRAFLRKTEKTWEIAFCGGEGLTTPGALVQAGMSLTAAHQLLANLKTMENGLSAATRSGFSLFEGIVPVNSAQPHAGHILH